MANDSIDIYQALSRDHRKVESLLDRLIQASKSDSDDWKSLLDEVRADLIPHSHAEEAVFYNALRDTEYKGLIAHSYGEHAMAEGELRSIEAAKLAGKPWTSLIEKLNRDLRHHISEEEGRVYDAARQVFSEEEARQIGAAFLRLKPEMQRDAESVTASTMDLVANLLPPRLVEGFRRKFTSGKKAA
jgi:hemerythrin superfamily protein